jgi:hypothetical protein
VLKIIFKLNLKQMKTYHFKKTKCDVALTFAVTLLWAFAVTFLLSNCVDDAQVQNKNITVPRAVLGTSAFNLYGNCGVNAYISGTAIVSPVGAACAPLFTGATEKYSQSASGFSFYGDFVGGSNAPDAYNEEAIFMADNISSWNGHEIGFVKKLNDNNLYGYIQSGGRGVYKLLYLTSGNTGAHTYKVLIPSGNHSQADYYIDGA